MKVFGFSIGQLWKLKKASDQFEKDKKMKADPTISIVKGLKAIAGLALFSGLGGMALFLLEPGVIEAALASAGVNTAYAAIIVLALRGAATAFLNWRKHNPPVASNQNAGPLVLLILALASPAFAQDQAPTSQRPEAAISCGGMRFAERGAPDHEDFVCRLSLAVPAPSGLTLFARADYTRTQGTEPDGDLFTLATFRSIEGFVGGRKDIAPNLSATAFAGVTWNRDKNIEPTDPRLWTVAGGLRYTVPKRGYVVAAFGHHGPVEGSAFLGSLVYEMSDSAAWFGDVAIPLGATRFALKPYTVRFGVSARVKAWKF